MADDAADDLAAWIDALRGRLARGELDGMPPNDYIARILLADLDHGLALAPDQRRAPPNVELRRVLLADLRRLRDRIG